MEQIKKKPESMVPREGTLFNMGTMVRDTIIGALATIAMVVIPRCSTCGEKLVVINTYCYCNNCGTVRSPK